LRVDWAIVILYVVGPPGRSAAAHGTDAEALNVGWLATSAGLRCYRHGLAPFWLATLLKTALATVRAADRSQRAHTIPIRTARATG
jgi:hypothetical protein